MRVLGDVITKMHDTMDEVEYYAEKAIYLKPTYKDLADCFIKIAEMHITIYGMLHEEVVDLIADEKRKGVQPPPEMIAIWNYEHERLTKEFATVKAIVSSY
jgi:hypothetical protein